MSQMYGFGKAQRLYEPRDVTSGTLPMVHVPCQSQSAGTIRRGVQRPRNPDYLPPSFSFDSSPLTRLSIQPSKDVLDSGLVRMSSTVRMSVSVSP